MSHAVRLCIVSVATLAALCTSQSAAAGKDSWDFMPAPLAIDKAGAVPARATLLGVKAVDANVLAKKRGGADVVNEMQLKGVVADNRAINVTTGNNLITEGAFAGTSGVPLVVQNSGNNVLIQNATIINVQVK